MEADFVLEIAEPEVDFVLEIGNSVLLIVKDMVERVLVTGVVNGINDTFVFDGEVVQVFNGIIKKEGIGYNKTSSTTVVFTAGNIPFTDDVIQAFGPEL